MRTHDVNDGFTLMELVIVVAIVSILAAIAFPSYTNHIVKSRRAAAEACLSNYANGMEVYYATNMRYDQDTGGNALTSLSTISLDCASTSNTGNYYSYSFASGSPSSTTYTLQAVPINSQLASDTQCGTLTLDQGGGRSPAAGCWAQ